MFKQQIEQMALIKNLTESLDTSHILCTLSYINSVSSLGPCYANLTDEVKEGNALVVQHPRLERRHAFQQQTVAEAYHLCSLQPRPDGDCQSL